MLHHFRTSLGKQDVALFPPTNFVTFDFKFSIDPTSIVFGYLICLKNANDNDSICPNRKRIYASDLAKNLIIFLLEINSFAQVWHYPRKIKEPN